MCCGAAGSVCVSNVCVVVLQGVCVCVSNVCVVVLQGVCVSLMCVLW